MINQKDVIVMLIPFPNIWSTLAVRNHMYICMKEDRLHHEFVKCQTLKYDMLINSPINSFVDEQADITRNPFVHSTRIDCDKVFTTDSVVYSEDLLTDRRRNVSDDLFGDIQKKLNDNPFQKIPLDEDDLVNLNYAIDWIF